MSDRSRIVVVAAALVDADGRVAGIMAVGQDITEREQAEAEEARYLGEAWPSQTR